MFVKELMLAKQANQKSVMFVTIISFFKKGFEFQPYVCNRYHNLLMMSMSLMDISIFNIKSSDYHCVVSEISKRGAIKLLKNIDFT